ncbi:MAG: Lrp/AsnC family transcriptional regulator [Spirochaetales bacterium]|nr:Lrp/AsnC family transcriptional regulator [Spirochaetales bacterium]
MTVNFDAIDSKIICLLQEDGRMPFTKIARELKIAESTVRARTQRLIQDGIIKIVAVSDPKMLGYEIYGNIKLIIDSAKIDSIIEKLRKLDEITYIALLTGDTDIDIDFIVPAFEDLGKLIYGKINRIDGIVQSRTSLIVGYEKDTYTWKTVLEQAPSTGTPESTNPKPC